ncbi:hypothetical protein AMTRI_Chr11g100490 [Amborella trichopoda]
MSEKLIKQSSLETEPRTLCIEQIQNAREAASYVMNNTSREEALSIFTEGLQPLKKTRGVEISDDLEFSSASSGVLLPCPFRDVLTAPF